ncbi:hypothetical protein CRE_11325 [Caenorhabditis remanei]|uniref:Uncharacterized protein n=2 Tax=Caenorhabditis remanei TaxID=31234 RepID=E3N0C6_CAERE|nr:hypothetical protein CRE_11325 [Caenorhabditis remanei]
MREKRKRKRMKIHIFSIISE